MEPALGKGMLWRPTSCLCLRFVVTPYDVGDSCFVVYFNMLVFLLVITIQLIHYLHCYVYFQQVITHQLDLARAVEGINLVSNSKESIKVVLLPNP